MQKPRSVHSKGYRWSVTELMLNPCQHCGLDGRLAANIDSIVRLVRKKDWDWVMLLDGPERSGKSELATQVQYHANYCTLIDNGTDFMISLEGKRVPSNPFSDPLRNLDYTVWTFEELKRVAIKATKGTALVFHESGIYGREYKKKANMEAIRVLTTIGAKNLLFIMTFPSMHMLDPYLRYHRIRTRGYVHTVGGERGYVQWSVRPFGPWNEGLAMPFMEAFTCRFRECGGSLSELWAAVREKDVYFKQHLLEGSSMEG